MNRPNRLPVLAGLLLAVIALTFAALTPHRAHAEHPGGPLQPSNTSATLNVTKGEHPTEATYSATLNWTTPRHRPAGGTQSTTPEYAPPSKYQHGYSTDGNPPSSWTNVNHTANKYNYSATISLADANTSYILWVRSCNSDASVCSEPLAIAVITPPQRPGAVRNFSAGTYEELTARRGFSYFFNPPNAPTVRETHNYEYEFQVRYAGESNWRSIVTLTNTSGHYNGHVVSITPQGKVYNFDSARRYHVRVRAVNDSGWGPWSSGVPIPAATDQAIPGFVYPDDYIRMQELGEQYDTDPRDNKIQEDELNRALDDYRAGRISMSDAVKVINLWQRQIGISGITRVP